MRNRHTRGKQYCLTGIAGAVALGALTTIATAAPWATGAPAGLADRSPVEHVAYVARRGVVVGRGYHGAYVGRYGYHRHYGYGVGAGVAGAAVGAAILGGALAAPYAAQPYGAYPQPYGYYYPQPYGYAPGYGYPPSYYPY
jgi:hypothetical protein